LGDAAGDALSLRRIHSAMKYKARLVAKQCFK
jgi:hypothetical protein